MAEKKKRVSRKRIVKDKKVREIVKKEIARNIEDKSIQFAVSDYNLYPSNATNFPNNTLHLSPNSSTLAIVQGTGQGNRVGNAIKIKKMRFKAMLTPQPWDNTLNPNPRPLIVRMVMYYDREDPNLLPAPGSTFFQNGSSSTGFSNSPIDILRPINTDRYKVFKIKDYKLGYSQYAGTANTVANQGAYQAYSNNDFKMVQMIDEDVTKYLVKHVKYNDNLSDPMTRGLYVTFFMIATDGTNLVSTWIPAEISYILDCTYEDA